VRPSFGPSPICSDVRVDGLALLRNSIAVTDSNGLATFTDLAVDAANNPVQFVAYFSEGMFSAPAPVYLRTSIGAVSIDGTFDTTLLEKDRFVHPPRVHVRTASGSNVPNATCFAHIISKSG